MKTVDDLELAKAVEALRSFKDPSREPKRGLVARVTLAMLRGIMGACTALYTVASKHFVALSTPYEQMMLGLKRSKISEAEFRAYVAQVEAAEEEYTTAKIVEAVEKNGVNA
jgi:hypothetical protein